MLIDQIAEQQFPDGVWEYTTRRRDELKKQFYGPKPVTKNLLSKPQDDPAKIEPVHKVMAKPLPFVKLGGREWLKVKPQSPMKTILESVAGKYGFTECELKGREKHKKITQARCEIIWRCKKETNFSYPIIGRFLGGRDHTTIISAFNKYERMIAMKASGLKDAPGQIVYDLEMLIDQ